MNPTESRSCQTLFSSDLFHNLAPLGQQLAMKSSPLPSVISPSAEVWRKVHSVCSQFEAQWGTASHFPIEARVADCTGEARSLLLTWLIRSELELRVNDQPVCQQEFYDRFPNDHWLVDQAFAPLRRRRSSNRFPACQATRSSARLVGAAWESSTKRSTKS